MEAEAVMTRAEQIAFARELHGTSVPHWSSAWPTIGDFQRAGLVRVRPLSRWMAEVEAVGDAAP